MIDTREIRALADACFVGPWRAGEFEVDCTHEQDCGAEHTLHTVEAPSEYPPSETDPQIIAEIDDLADGTIDVPGLQGFAEPHARFIAEARTLVPAMCDEIDSLRAALRWRRCEDEMPPNGESVSCITGAGYPRIMSRHAGDWFIDASSAHWPEPRLWMPIPPFEGAR